MRPRRSWLLRAALFAVAAGTLLPSAPATAQDGAVPALGGYEGTAIASVVQLEYNPEGLLPIAAPVDLGVPDALATIGTGPATYARSSVADPGDVLANPGALLSQAIEQYEAGTIPPYPFRVEVSSALGDPEATSAPAPGLAARARADGEGSYAEATMPVADAPPLLRVGSQRALATTSFDGSRVTVRARSEVGGIDLFGILTIDSVVTDLTATSDGIDTEIVGGTTLAEARLLGQAITIDADGISVDGSSLLSLLPLGDLTDLLEGLGISVTVDEPVVEEGRLASTGLTIQLRLSPDTVPALLGLKDLLALVGEAIPDAGLGDLAGILDARHVLTFELGRGMVSLATQPGFAFDPPPIQIDDPAPPPPPVPSFGSAAPDLGSSLPAPAVPPASAAPPATEVPSTFQPVGSEPPDAPFGKGVGVAALLALAVQPMLGQRLARASAAVLAPAATAACPQEGR